MLLDHIIGAVEVADADDGDFAQPAVERGLKARRRNQIEPACRQRRRVQQQLVDIDERAAPAGADLADQLGEFGVVVFLNIGDAGHGAFEWLEEG